MIRVKNISYENNAGSLIENVSFEVFSGNMLQIVGRNGAGKTTLIKLILGLLPPTSGGIYRKYQCTDRDNCQPVGCNPLWVGHQSGMKMTLSAEENLKFYHPHTTQEIRRCALEKVYLAGYEDIQLASLSAGQQRRVALARLWLSDARLWILDEPFTALDSWGCTLIAQQMRDHIDRGGMVIFTSHQPIPILDSRVQIFNMDVP
ncbi:cytochrome c biogenesis heme-transporting ATPase CcmA [Scandinavium sp. NPDC088450]|uniref:cytochrome c biogenesis heme-transporting ATPase CcmA n=1 Tax=Scandinavium sp. NPDC088450 TaxID=3364514 RepID=UPI00384E0D6E